MSWISICRSFPAFFRCYFVHLKRLHCRHLLGHWIWAWEIMGMSENEVIMKKTWEMAVEIGNLRINHCNCGYHILRQPLLWTSITRPFGAWWYQGIVPCPYHPPVESSQISLFWRYSECVVVSTTVVWLYPILVQELCCDECFVRGLHIICKPYISGDIYRYFT